ncbi:hypothetical protein NG798_09360 [Ancylothrix sp. C2]|uniref:hypothetical protein n=1 Tax=Ancylothrix sp. D3o TaxID=2953691 RepID=UPI0021BABE4E|nr:hypothetical protein [Ancylothrix sp. D3o]MCT7949993.1 hypothetical protein [Ancylothrix sp. D3o]
MSLTPDEYVNLRLDKLEKHDAITAEKAYQNERRIDDFKSVVSSQLSAINTKLEFLTWAFFTIGAGLLAVVLDIIFKRK